MRKFVVGLVVCFLLVVAVPVFGQSRITLNSLQDSIADIELSVDEFLLEVRKVVRRVDRIEGLMYGEARSYSGEYCRLGRRDRLHPSSAASYLSTYPDASTPDTRLEEVFFFDSGLVGVVHEDWLPDRYVVEVWDGCDFVGASDWMEESEYDSSELSLEGSIMGFIMEAEIIESQE